MWLLVILYIPKTEELCAKMREVAETKTRKTPAGASRVVEVMETINLPQLHKEWMVEDSHKAKKIIACMVYKYVRVVMFNETSATHMIVDKFKVKQTTIHRQLYGKKYPGGGQTLEKMKAHTTTRPVDQSKTSAKTKDTAEEDEAKISKGKGKGKKSQVKRTAEEIRKESTSEKEKEKAKKRKAEEAMAMEEEDEDRPTAEEIKCSKPTATRKGLFIH